MDTRLRAAKHSDWRYAAIVTRLLDPKRPIREADTFAASPYALNAPGTALATGQIQRTEVSAYPSDWVRSAGRQPLRDLKLAHLLSERLFRRVIRHPK